MTKAESRVFASKLWRNAQPETASKHDGSPYFIRVYERVISTPSGSLSAATHRLACDSYYGDSKLSRWDLNLQRWIDLGNIEMSYDGPLLSGLL